MVDRAFTMMSTHLVEIGDIIEQKCRCTIDVGGTSVIIEASDDDDESAAMGQTILQELLEVITFSGSWVQCAVVGLDGDGGKEDMRTHKFRQDSAEPISLRSSGPI